MALVVPPTAGVHPLQALEPCEQRAADQPDPLLEGGDLRERQQGPPRPPEAVRIGVLVPLKQGRVLRPAREVAGDGFGQLQGQVRRCELLLRDPPPVVEGPPQGDHRQPPPRRLPVVPRRLPGRGVEGVGERLHLRAEPLFQLQEGSERRQGLGSGQRLQRRDRERGDAQEGESRLRRRAQAAPLHPRPAGA